MERVERGNAAQRVEWIDLIGTGYVKVEGPRRREDPDRSARLVRTSIISRSRLPLMGSLLPIIPPSTLAHSQYSHLAVQAVSKPSVNLEDGTPTRLAEQDKRAAMAKPLPSSPFSPSSSFAPSPSSHNYHPCSRYPTLIHRTRSNPLSSTAKRGPHGIGPYLTMSTRLNGRRAICGRASRRRAGGIVKLQCTRAGSGDLNGAWKVCMLDV